MISSPWPLPLPCLVNPCRIFYIYMRVCVHFNPQMGSQISLAYNKTCLAYTCPWRLLIIYSHITNFTKELHSAHKTSHCRTCSDQLLSAFLSMWEIQGWGQSQTTKTHLRLLCRWQCIWCPFTFHWPKWVVWPSPKSWATFDKTSHLKARVKSKTNKYNRNTGTWKIQRQMKSTYQKTQDDLISLEILLILHSLNKDRTEHHQTKRKRIRAIKLSEITIN